MTTSHRVNRIVELEAALHAAASELLALSNVLTAADMLGTSLRALRAASAAATALRASSRRLHRHAARGTLYEVVGSATLQCSLEALDEAHVTVYRSADGSRLWVRPTTEFYDGRFVRASR